MLEIGKKSSMLMSRMALGAVAALFAGSVQPDKTIRTRWSAPSLPSKRSWRDKVPTEVYRHQMITASPREIAAWNKNVVAEKSKRRSDRYRRFSDARAALTRSAFDTLREYRHGLRNYVVAKAGG